jgi:hypothetical protein
MRDLYVPAHRIIPAREWRSPQRRAAFEREYGVATGPLYYTFSGPEQFSTIIAVDALAEGIVKARSKNLGGEAANHGVLHLENFDSPDRSFSDGFIVFTAASRQIIERDQSFLVGELNMALEGLCSAYRLAPTPEPQF